MREIRVFVSSPQGAEDERKTVEHLIRQLGRELPETARFKPILWENDVYEAFDTIQNLIPQSSGCDIVIAILKHRLGTPFPESYPRMPPEPPFDGEPYPSGTAYEILSAIAARREAIRDGTPDRAAAVYVFRSTERPVSAIDDTKTLKENVAQWNKLCRFVDRFIEGPSNENLAAYNKYQGIEEFRRQVSMALNQWLENNFGRRPDAIWSIALKGSPFRGLQPFDACHRDVYFGRSRKVENAIDELVHHSEQAGALPLLFIIGASGAGKSSMMRAGITPRLTQPGRVPGVSGWRIAVARLDEDDAFTAVARALLVRGAGGGAKESDDPGGFGPALPELAAMGYSDPSTLARFLATIETVDVPIRKCLENILALPENAGAASSGEPMRLLLLLDQFEGIFTDRMDDARRDAFARLLFHLSSSGCVWIVATVRSDQYHRLLEPGDFIAIKDRAAQYDLAIPGEAELSEIIECSAQAAGLLYEVCTEGADKGRRLDEVLLADAVSDGSLPLLQFCLETLFQECVLRSNGTVLTFDAYRKMAGIGGALKVAADGAIANLDRDARASLPALLRKLVVRLSKLDHTGRVQYALAIRPEVRSVASRGPATDRLIDALIGARILVASTVGKERVATISIAHQKVLECWPTAVEELANYAEYFEVVRYIAEAMATWKVTGHRGDLLRSPHLDTARDQLARYPDDFDGDARAFVRQSMRWAAFERGRAWIVSATLGVALVAAVYFGVESERSLEQARADFTAARETVDSLVDTVTNRMMRIAGLRLKTIEVALTAIHDAVDKLAGSRNSTGDAPLLRTRANMLYNFAKLYQNTGEEERVRVMAATSLDLRRRLLRYPPEKPRDWDAGEEALWADLAKSLDLDGDIARRTDRGAALRSYTSAQTIRTHFLDAPDRRRKEWPIEAAAGWVRIGDLDANVGPGDASEKAHRLHRAYETYSKALAVVGPTFVGTTPPEIASDVEREVSWGLGKLAGIEMQTDRHASALAHYEGAVCLRRKLMQHDPDSDQAKRDLAFALERQGAAALAVAMGGGSGASSVSVSFTREEIVEQAYRAFVESLMYRQRLALSDRGNFLYQLEQVETIARLPGLFDIQGRIYHARDALDEALRLVRDLLERRDDTTPSRDFSRANDLRKRLEKAIADRTAQLRDRRSDGEVSRSDPLNLDSEIMIVRHVIGRSVLDDCLADTRREVHRLIEGTRAQPRG